MKRRKEVLGTGICPECGEYCKIIALDSSFSYSGTHCTHGRAGVHYPPDHGQPVSDCCEEYISEDDALEFWGER